VRNSQVLDLVRELESYNIQVFIYDPIVDAETLGRLGMKVIEDPFKADAYYDAVIIAVPHQRFRKQSVEDYVRLVRGSKGVIVDVRGIISRKPVEDAGVVYWTL
jgi:UDP-N-acetyl-D-galactosamine dehydrogenase